MGAERSVTYSMNTSLDGYVVGPDGGFTWAGPDDEVFLFATEQLREVGVHLLGRRLYETMLYWETADADGTLDAARREWAERWKALPKVVFSRTLTSVEGTNTRLATGSLSDEIARLRADPAVAGNIALGGAALADAAAAEDLIDEYRPKVCPVLVGGGVPFFPVRERRVELELVESRVFASGLVYLRQRVVR